MERDDDDGRKKGGDEPMIFAGSGGGRDSSYCNILSISIILWSTPNNN